MPSLTTARRVANAKNNGAKTIGQIYKGQSDWAMEETFWSDPQSKVAYIYDYFHDDQPDIKDHMTYENTTKTRIDIKFIVKSYQSMDKDQVEYYIQFKPSEKIEFIEDDELYYYEKDFRKKYGADYPIGLFVDIPDDREIYHKWLICREEIANQFPKYLVLPLNYHLYWIERNNTECIKRNMWCVMRQQSNYTSGSYTDKIFSRGDNQTKLWFSMNSITEKFWYTDNEDENMRLIVSAPIAQPVTWRITKCESAQPLGIQKLTLYQDRFDEHADYVNLETGEMYADYYTSEITPTNPDDNKTILTTSVFAKITSTSSTIKVSGSYKTINLSFYNESGEDITLDFENADITWRFIVDDTECDSVIKKDTAYNEKKIKLSDNYDLLGKILTISCTIFKEDIGYIQSEVFQMSITE